MVARSLGPVDDLFSPPGTDWRPVSPSLTRLRRTDLVASVAFGVALVVVGAVLGVPTWLWVAALVALAGGAAWGWVLIARITRSWGYAERDGELYIKHGALMRELVVVPFGRLQYVDVQAGPLEQAFKVASVHLHTASPGTSARIPGLPAAEATRLRDRLTSLGESQAAGL